MNKNSILYVSTITGLSAILLLHVYESPANAADRTGDMANMVETQMSMFVPCYVLQCKCEWTQSQLFHVQIRRF